MVDVKYILEMPFSRRQRLLKEGRAPMTEESFIGSSSSTKAGAMAAHLLWKRLNDEKCISDFYPDPSDAIEHTYGIADDEFVDLIVEILKEVEALPSPEKFRRLPHPKTTKDVVQFVEQCERLKSSA
jgi:hypothetical protein